MNGLMTVCSVLLGLGLALTSGAQARTWKVEKDGSGDFTIIQDALDAAASGDTVQVGVGRFDDFSYSGTSALVSIARVRVPDLVIIGVSPEATILGPETRIPDTQDAEYNIVRLEPGTGAEIGSLSMENSRAALNNSGRLTLDNVRVSGQWAGIFDGSSDPLVVRNSHFEECTDYGILTGPTTAPVTVEDCSFFNVEGAVFLNAVENGIIRRCTFRSTRSRLTGVMVTQGSYGLIEDCRFLASPDCYGVWIVDATATLNRNWFGEGEVNVGGSNGCYFEGTGNVLKGGNLGSLYIASYGSWANFHGNDIYSKDGPALRIIDYLLPATHTVDVRNNWWGTADSDSIEAMIVFQNADPSEVEVLWQPFLTVPVPVQEASVGSLKSLFHRR